jgi:non-specific protein-tyrosine kinase
MVGVLLAGGIIFLVEYLDDTIRDPQEIVRKWGVPILGIITRYKNSGGALITLKQPRAPVSEAFRSLRTNLEFSAVDTPLETILVTSPSPRDGKTTIAANLACVLAQSNRRVVAVDADLRRPQIHKSFHLMNRLGLTDQLIQSQRSVRVVNNNQPIPVKEQLDGCIQDTELASLKVITSGGLPPDPSVLLGSLRMQELMVSLRDRFDCVILDTPPVLMVTDAVVLAPRVGGVIIVVKPSVTKRAGLHHVIEQLRQVNARVLGVVINNVDVKRSRYFYYRRYNSGYRDKYPKGYANQDTSPAEKKKDATNRIFL